MAGAVPDAGVLAGRVAVVTGAGRGIGRAHAVALAAAGARVVVNDVGCDVGGVGADASVAAAVVDEIRIAGGEAVASEAAVGTVEAGEAIVRAALDAFGRLDVLVNNAGITRSHPFEDFPIDEWERLLRVHLSGTFACARAAYRVMLAAGRGGRILNTTSGAGLQNAYPGSAGYAAAKGGIASLTRVIAVEGAAHGITCNAIAPLARTRMSGGFLGARAAEEHDPALLGPLVVYLASPASAGVTGEIFRCAEGRIARGGFALGEAIAPAGAGWTVDELARRIPTLVSTR